MRCITVTSSLYLQTSGSHIDPVVPPQVTEAPHSLTNGTHAVSSFPQPPLIQSGAAKPAASGNEAKFSLRKETYIIAGLFSQAAVFTRQQVEEKVALVCQFVSVFFTSPSPFTLPGRTVTRPVCVCVLHCVLVGCLLSLSASLSYCLLPL